jgi:hypothetical protein
MNPRLVEPGFVACLHAGGPVPRQDEDGDDDAKRERRHVEDHDIRSDGRRANQGCRPCAFNQM